MNLCPIYILYFCNIEIYPISNEYPLSQKKTNNLRPWVGKRKRMLKLSKGRVNKYQSFPYKYHTKKGQRRIVISTLIPINLLETAEHNLRIN